MSNTHSLDLELSSSQYAYVADNADVSVTGDISIEAWIKLEQKASTAGTNFLIVDKSYIVISHNDVDAVGKVQFIANNIKQ